MKIIELLGKNLTIAITNEEAELLNEFDEESPIMAKRDMTERQIILANQLVNKDVLFRKNEDQQIIYKKRSR